MTFSIRGERGSIDILAFFRGTASLLVVEMKSVVPDLQAMLVALDRKGRIGREVARERGWEATSVTRLLVLPEDRTARRRVAALATTFRTALPARTVEVRRWVEAPGGTCHGILFMAAPPRPVSANQAYSRQVTTRRELGRVTPDTSAVRPPTERGTLPTSRR